MKQQRNIQDYKIFALAEKKARDLSFCLLTSKEIVEGIGLSPIQTAKLLSRLVAQGRIGQLQRKLYIVPGRLPPGKIWKPSSYLVLASYMSWLGAKWQITGLDAFSRHGFTTQLPQKIFLYNDKLSGEFSVAGSKFIFIKIAKRRIGSYENFQITDSDLKIIFSSKARTLFDAIFDYKRFGTLPKAYTWVAAVKKDKELIGELIDCAVRYGNKITIQRLGFVLGKLGIKESTLLRLKKKIGKSKTLVSLAPGTRAGVIDKTWNVIENISLKTLLENVEEF